MITSYSLPLEGREKHDLTRRYLIGSGYHEGREGRQEPEFFPLWLANTHKYSLPTQIVVLADSGSIPPFRPPHCSRYCSIHLTGNLGYHLDLLNGTKQHHFPGGPGMLMALAMLAYCDEADFIYKEQDCLWFGDCVGEMYRQIGEGGIIFGKCDAFPATNSLMLVKHAYIPEFLRLYLGTPPEHDETQLCERKFERLLAEHPEQWKQFDFGYDRDRPFDVTDKVWYAQQFTAEELTLLRDAGLI